MTRLGKSIAIAAEVHKGQVDKGGEPYILHPLAVMQKVADSYGYTDDEDNFRREELLCSAVLHDAFEDYKSGRWGLRNVGGLDKLKDEVEDTLGEIIFVTVDALTKTGSARDPEAYDAYIDRVSQNWMARIVKIADLSHNLDTTRLPSGQIKEADFARWDKYHRALVRLSRESA